MKVSRTLAVVGSLVFILSIILTYNWMTNRRPFSAIAKKHINTKIQTKKAHPLPKKHILSKAKKLKKSVKHPKLKKRSKPVAHQPKLKPKKQNRVPAIPLLDIFKAKNQPRRGQTIFFHETTNFQKDEKVRLIQLTAREACAIESAALHNPRLTVFVLFAGATHRKSSNDSLVKALSKYKNIRLRHLNVWSYAAGTPIEKWLKNGKLFKSKFLFPHVSDLLRYVTLYKYGGLYLDLDVVVQRSLEKMPPNFTGAESNKNLACGVMKMSSTGLGHKIATLCLLDLQANYDANKWGSNGPGVITRVAKSLCNTDSIQAMINNPKRCKGFKVYDAKAFYSIPWLQWKDFFQPIRLNVTMKRISNSSVVHFWNKFSRGWKLKTKDICVYTKLAKTHCPKSFAAAGTFF
ncbi:lactosylceramide 4-alpha-galactosyltransferase [Drosophila rhopaloa]|uniref:Alpha 1,4-glycosyltransferase domain-containing protein n=1 Tax=Drosophila rhopaloa TaxID=1041015 RepID=A0ABM5GUR5_DRORH|nr:lactosylceramide 4-alpha-galactosyltransferase [Drosophila rhopaloa]